MFTTIASIFGMSAADFATVVAAIAGGMATVLTAVAPIIKSLIGGRRRAFVKIRRLEEIVVELAQYAPPNPYLEKFMAEMKADQRDESDEKDSA